MTMTLERQTLDIQTMTEDAATPRMTRGRAQAMLNMTTGKIKLRDVPPEIRAARPFISGSMRASRGPDGSYTVWSYHEPIGGRTASGVWWYSRTRHSATTSRHQRVLVQAFGAAGIEAVATDA